MKACPLCGIDAEDAVSKCTGCGYKFAGTEQDDGDDQAWSAYDATPPQQRPDGGTPMMLGWLCLMIALILAAVAYSQGPESWQISAAGYGSTSALSGLAEAHGRQWTFQLASGGFFSLFLVFWSVGYIVRAISFLPGNTGSQPAD